MRNRPKNTRASGSSISARKSRSKPQEKVAACDGASGAVKAPGGAVAPEGGLNLGKRYLAASLSKTDELPPPQSVVILKPVNEEKLAIYKASTLLLNNANDSKLRKYGIRQASCRLAAWDRVFTDVRKDGSIGHDGILFCHNRLSCPYCFAHYASTQRLQTVNSFQAWIKKDPHNNSVLVVTLTVPHSKKRRLTRRLLKLAWRELSQNHMEELKEIFGWFGHVKRYEITLAEIESLDHPHLHLGVFCEFNHEDRCYQTKVEGEDLVQNDMTEELKEHFDEKKRLLYGQQLSEKLWEIWSVCVKEALKKLPGESMDIPVFKRLMLDRDDILASSPHYDESKRQNKLPCLKPPRKKSNICLNEACIKARTQLSLIDLKIQETLRTFFNSDVNADEFVKKPYIEGQYIKGGVACEVPRNSEAWADYLSMELNYGGLKEASKEGGKAAKKYVWQELLLSGEPWAAKAFRDYIIEHAGERLFEFSQKAWDGVHRMSLYKYLCGIDEQDEELKAFDVMQKETENHIQTYISPSESWNETIRDPEKRLELTRALDEICAAVKSGKPLPDLAERFPKLWYLTDMSYVELLKIRNDLKSSMKRNQAKALVRRGMIYSEFVLKNYFDGDKKAQKAAIKEAMQKQFPIEEQTDEQILRAMFGKKQLKKEPKKCTEERMKVWRSIALEASESRFCQACFEGSDKEHIKNCLVMSSIKKSC